jgi:hypothetical protein
MRCDVVFVLVMIASLVPLAAEAEEQRVDLPSLIGPLTLQDLSREFGFDAKRSLEDFETLVLHLEGGARPGVLEGAGSDGERAKSGAELSVFIVEPVVKGPAVAPLRRLGVHQRTEPLEGPFSVDLTVSLSSNLQQRVTGRGALHLRLYPPVRASVCDRGCRFVEPPSLQITQAYLVLQEAPRNQPGKVAQVKPGKVRGGADVQRTVDSERPIRAATPIGGSMRPDPVSISPIRAREPNPVNRRVTLSPRHPKTTAGEITLPEAGGPTDTGEYPRACNAPQRPRDPLLSNEARERARDLLAEIEVEIGDTLVVARVEDERIERSDGSVFEGTSIYCEQRYEGLPVLYGRVHFAFYHGDSGRMPRNDINRRAKGKLIGDGDIEADLWPQVEREEAIDIYRKIGVTSAHPTRLPFPSEDGCDPRAQLVLWNEMGGRPDPPHYLLVWNVRPGGDDYYPQAIIDAKTGEVRFADDGIRY